MGYGRPRALDRNAKARIMRWARCLASERATGVILHAALEVVQALLWGFHRLLLRSVRPAIASL
jgi:hypothetical protein